jgi:hypothetical protein
MKDVLEELKSLRRGWDGHEAAGPKASAIKDVEAFVNMITDSSIEIVPLIDGDVSMDFTHETTDDLMGIIEFSGKGSLQFGHDEVDYPSTDPTKRRLMIDIESTSLEADAGVWEIGYWEIGSDYDDVLGEVAFNGSFLMNPYEQGRIVDEETVKWLGNNCDNWYPAKEQFLYLEESSVLLNQFQKDVSAQGFDEVWCKGADFDFAVLRSLFRSYDIPMPWHYRLQCCMRSYLNTFPEFKQRYTPNQAHSGMYDARTQAVVIEEILKYLDRY